MVEDDLVDRWPESTSTLPPGDPPTWRVREVPPLKYKEDIARAYILTRSGRFIKRANIQAEMKRHGIHMHFNTILKALRILKEENLATLTQSGGRSLQWKIASIHPSTLESIKRAYDTSVRLYREVEQ